MKKINNNLNESRQSLQKRLILTMLIFMLVLSSLLVGGLFLFRQVSIPGKEIADALEQQQAFFVKDTLDYWNTLSVRSLDLSDDLSEIIENDLTAGVLASEDLSYANNKSTAMEGKLVPVLRQKLLQTNCSGSFVFFKTENEDAMTVPGIYLRKDIHHISKPQLYMYRGAYSAAESNDIPLHSKWHNEVNPRLLPEYQEVLQYAQGNDAEDYIMISGMSTLSLTDEKVVLVLCPLKSTSGEVYGICGYEVSERYFRAVNEQPTGLTRLICMISKADIQPMSADSSLHCGYHYVRPNGSFTNQTISNGLLRFISDDKQKHQYIGKQEKLYIPFAKTDVLVTVMVPCEDYDQSVSITVRQYIVLGLLILFAGGACIWYFSRLYLRPIRLSLASMKQNNYEDKAGIHELDDLSDYMQSQNTRHKDELDALQKEKQNAETEADRLAYDRKKEVDPLFYEQFVKALKTLTPSERQILNLVGDGKTTKEIINQLSISENTLKFHMKNIYSKLDVHSRKQAAMYLNIYRRENPDKS